MNAVSFQDPVLIYIISGMVCTWLVQMHCLRFKQMNRIDRMFTSFVCSILTPAVALPLLDLFPQLPNSILLIVGAVIGTVGFSGWSKLATSVLTFVVKYVGEPHPDEEHPQHKDPENDIQRQHRK